MEVRRVRTRPLALLGLLVLAPVLTAGAWSSAAVAPAPKPSGELVVLSYNVAGLPEPLSGSEPATNAPLISPLLNAYDLVLLQESWGDSTGLLGSFHYHDQLVAAADHPYRSEPAPNPMGLDPRRPGALLADGLNRLSRLPFAPIDRQMWEACNGELALAVGEAILDGLGIGDLPVADQVDGGAADCGALKGFSVARTELAPGVEMDVYNLHADASSSPADMAARADNFRQLAAFIVEHSQGRAVILGGDTNLKSPRDVGVWDGFLAATGLQDACQLVDCGEDHDRIDKVAVRSGGRVSLEVRSHHFERERFQRSDGEPLSDHDPLAVRIRWRAARVGAPSTAAPAIAARGVPNFAG